MKSMKLVNIPICIFILFSISTLIIPNTYYICGMLIAGLVSYKCEKFKYDEIKSLDDNKQDILKYIEKTTDASYKNLNIKIQDINTNMSKISLSKGFGRK